MKRLNNFLRRSSARLERELAIKEREVAVKEREITLQERKLEHEVKTKERELDLTEKNIESRDNHTQVLKDFISNEVNAPSGGELRELGQQASDLNSIIGLAGTVGAVIVVADAKREAELKAEAKCLGLPLPGSTTPPVAQAADIGATTQYFA